MTAVVDGVKDDIWYEIDGLVTDLKEKDAAQGLDDEEKEKLNALKTLDPHRDIQGYFDYLNAHFSSLITALFIKSICLPLSTILDTTSG